jgi:FkbM family methyltransferase
MDEANTFVGQMFEIPKGAIEALKNRRKIPQAKEQVKLCIKEFKDDPGSQARCLVNTGLLKLALRLARKWLAEKRPLRDDFTRQTTVLLQFLVAYIFEVGANEEEAIKAYREFLITSGRLTIYNEQLELLMMKAYSKVRESGNHDKLHVTMVRTKPTFLISTLDPLQDAWFSFDIQKQGMWEVHTAKLWRHVAGLVKEAHGAGSLVVDVGANHGFFALYSGAMGFKVSAWEAVPSIASKLQESVHLNGWEDQVKVSNRIITTKSHKKLWVHPFVLGPSPTAYVRFDNKRASDEMYDKLLIQVDGVRADKGIKSQHGFSPSDVRVLKIDVEGCELDALLSSSEMLKPNGAKPELFLEVCPSLLSRCQTTHKDEIKAWNMLLKLKYAMRVYWHDGGQIKADFARESVKVNSWDGTQQESMWRVPNDIDAIDDWVQSEKQGSDCFLMWASQLH